MTTRALRDLAMERRCAAWARMGDPLRASVAWRLYQGDGAILSVGTGVALSALIGFAETGEIDAIHRTMLETMR